ncbi:1,4-dihydroxy-6-naphthoate synthase [Desulfobacterales bacterium HSG2]|nr:1,4-dihydroxy-6-naphthoate synthase [Desulfobacterales bacterium HSG2]
MPELNIAFSSCPNDTFIFHAMLHQCVETGSLRFTPYISDVEELNRKAFSETFHITKLSFYAYLHLKTRYDLLDSGSALGYGCGPMLVAKSPPKSWADAKIAIPGEYTTAHLLLKLWRPEIRHTEAVRFDYILPGVASGKYDAGLIIHEGRFVYPEYNCIKIVDLGEWWEAETRLPIPLGCIAIRRDPRTIQYKRDLESVLRASVAYAFENPDASAEFVKSHAKELEKTVINDHIQLYVNDFTVSLGETGMKAIQKLEEMAACRKIL